LPQEFRHAVTQVTAAVCCLGCRHCHLLGPRLTFPGRTNDPIGLDAADERRSLRSVG
jgi:hypothetical protein